MSYTVFITQLKLLNDFGSLNSIKYFSNLQNILKLPVSILSRKMAYLVKERYQNASHIKSTSCDHFR